MAGDVSIRIRAVDMTRAVFGRVRAGLSSLSAGASSVVQSFKRIGSLTGAFGGALALRSVVGHMRELADLARETGNYDIISRQQVDNLSGAAKYLRMMKDASASLLASGLAKLFGGGGRLGELGSVESQLAEATAAESESINRNVSRVADEKGNAEAVKYINLLLKTQTNQKIINDLIDRRAELARKASAEEKKSAEDRLRAEQEIAKEKQRQYEADQERQAEYEQKNFDERKSAADKIRAAVMTPLGLQRLMKEEREGEKADAKWARLVVKAQEKQKKIIAGRVGMHLTKKESAILMANEMNQQDQAMGKNIAGVEENTRKMLEALVENLRLK